MLVGLMGALAGLVVGYVCFEAMNMVAKRTEKPETAKILRIAGLADVVAMPVVGFFVAPVLFGGS